MNLSADKDIDLAHARWLYTVSKVFEDDGSYSLITHTSCSACNYEITEGTEKPICPKCGARMDAAWRQNNIKKEHDMDVEI